MIVYFVSNYGYVADKLSAASNSLKLCLVSFPTLTNEDKLYSMALFERILFVK